MGLSFEGPIHLRMGAPTHPQVLGAFGACGPGSRWGFRFGWSPLGPVAQLVRAHA